MTALADLIARVEKAEGPDREIDAAICLALESDRFGQWRAARPKGLMLSIEDDLARFASKRGHLTASLDAAVALVERRLPELWEWSVRCYGKPPQYCAYVDAPAGGKKFWHFDTYIANAAAPALAIILALLRVMQAQEQTK